MNTENLTSMIALILALSIASERLVEIIKGWIPFLSNANADPTLESRRKSVLQLLAVLSGIGTAILSADYLPAGLSGSGTGWGIVGLGLLASGGSGLWNSVLSYMTQLKDLKKIEVESKR